jgi:hypothetical protein
VWVPPAGLSVVCHFEERGGCCDVLLPDWHSAECSETPVDSGYLWTEGSWL